MTAHDIIVDWVNQRKQFVGKIEASTTTLTDEVRQYGKNYFNKYMSASSVDRRWREFRADESLRKRAGVTKIDEHKAGAQTIWTIHTIG